MLALGLGIGIPFGASAGGAGSAADPAGANIVLHIPFNDLADAATDAYDWSLKPHSVTDFQGNAQIDTAQFKFGSSSLLLDGTNDYVRTPDHADWILAAGGFSIEAWVRFSDTNDTQEIVNQYTASGDQRSWRFFFSSTTGLGFQLFDDGTSTAKYSINFAWSPDPDTWYHVAVCRDTDGTTRLFIDGSTGGDTSTDNTASFNSTSRLHIGANGAGGNDYAGWIQDVRVVVGEGIYTADFAAPSGALDTTYNAATDSAYPNVVLLMPMNGADTATVFPDYSKFNHPTAQVDGNAQVDTAEKKFGTGSLLLDGTDDVVQITDNVNFDFAAGEDFTIECWVRVAYDTSTKTTQMIAHDDASGNQRSWRFGINGDEKLELYVSPSGGSGSEVFVTSTSAQTWTIGTWYHIAVDRNSADLIRLYKDGVVIGSATDSVASFTTTSELSVGGRLFVNAVFEGFDGHLDGVRVTIGTARYDGAFTPATTRWPTHP